MFLNLGKNDTKNITIKIGKDEINQENSAKLLGISFDDNQKWDTQINGKGGIISSLNQRLFLLRRLANSINRKALKSCRQYLHFKGKVWPTVTRKSKMD